MSDHWEFYPCQMDEHQAFIFYDHGIREELDALEHPDALKIRVRFQLEADNGLPLREEFERLSALEDLMTARVEALGGVYVGRVTVAGAKYFHCFVSATREEVQAMLHDVSAESGYELNFVLKPDPRKESYWDELFPSAEEWRVIQDMKVLEVLERHGDDHSIPRRIDHWSYFPAPANREAFAAWAVENGFAIQQQMDPHETSDEWGVQIYHEARPELSEVTAITALLSEQSAEFGGRYDGWETRVENSAN